MVGVAAGWAVAFPVVLVVVVVVAAVLAVVGVVVEVVTYPQVLVGRRAVVVVRPAEGEMGTGWVLVVEMVWIADQRTGVGRYSVWTIRFRPPPW